VTYQCQYCRIDSRISDYDHKCEARNAKLQIGSDGSNKIRRNPRVKGYESWFALPRVRRSEFWTDLELNRSVLQSNLDRWGITWTRSQYYSSTLRSILSTMSPLALPDTLSAYLALCFQVHSQEANHSQFHRTICFHIRFLVFCPGTRRVAATRHQEADGR
jgi:hypothetical protein